MAAVNVNNSLDNQGADGDVISVTSKRVSCDGGGGALGHPRVWLDMGVENRVVCKYCDRVFVFAGMLGDGDGNAKT